MEILKIVAVHFGAWGTFWFFLMLQESERERRCKNGTEPIEAMIAWIIIAGVTAALTFLIRWGLI